MSSEQNLGTARPKWALFGQWTRHLGQYLSKTPGVGYGSAQTVTLEASEEGSRYDAVRGGIQISSSNGSSQTQISYFPTSSLPTAALQKRSTANRGQRSDLRRGLAGLASAEKYLSGQTNHYLFDSCSRTFYGRKTLKPCSKTAQNCGFRARKITSKCLKS